MFQVNGEKKQKKSKKKGMEKGEKCAYVCQPVLLLHGITLNHYHPVLCDCVPCVPLQPPPAVMRRMILTPAPSPSGQRRRRTQCPSSGLEGTPPRKRRPKRKVRAWY